MLPTGFEPVSKPREGFMIGRYTTGATWTPIEIIYFNISLKPNVSGNRTPSFTDAPWHPEHPSTINTEWLIILEVKTERIIAECGSNPSAVMDLVYRRIVREGGLDFLR